ncbi:hypothetical protein OH492_12800 [Vibrio chagasii]|nr:hypothetical protein [Vibrio chagasii]
MIHLDDALGVRTPKMVQVSFGQSGSIELNIAFNVDAPNYKSDGSPDLRRYSVVLVTQRLVHRILAAQYQFLCKEHEMATLLS